jgi:hypothetical protein
MKVSRSKVLSKCIKFFLSFIQGASKLLNEKRNNVWRTKALLDFTDTKE